MTRPNVARKQTGPFWLLAICFTLIGGIGAYVLAQDGSPKDDAPVDPPAAEQPSTPTDPDTTDAEEPGWGEVLQAKADTAFGEANYYIEPILFFDVSFGVFDPSLASIEKDLVDADGRLKDEIEKLEGDAEAEKAFNRFVEIGKQPTDPVLRDRIEPVVSVFKEVAELTSWADTIKQRPVARENLAEAREAYAKAKENFKSIRDTLTEEELEAAKAILAEEKAKYREVKAASKANVHSVPLIIVFLLLGAVFFTFRYGFVNLRLFGHSIAVIRGKYDNPDDHGEISHFQALTSALSATVGLGNIAGVAIAISQGGAGAVFWMWVVAFFGMSSKFTSCTLAQVYRKIGAESADRGTADETHKPLPGGREHVLGGPMIYLTQGMKDVFGKALGTPIGKVLAISFAFFAICGSLGGGNMFQGNQTFAILSDVVFHQSIEGEDELIGRVEQGDAAAAKELREKREAAQELKEQRKKEYAWVGGLGLAFMVGIVIVGGIKRIGEVTSRLVPTMCLFYVGVCLIIVVANAGRVPDMLADIVNGAFSREAVAWGGIMGVLVVGIKRGAFSNEAGLGSAAIAHSAAKTKEPVREGVVAMIGPFIDTIVVCTMTALAILITGAHKSGAAETFSDEGVGITARAFSDLAPQLTILLTIAVFIFAYSTMISWSYYGERASEYLFGHHGIWPFRIVFLLFVFLGPMVSLTNVIGFTDLLILSMAYPNILGMVFLSGKVAKLTKDYVCRLRSGEMKPYQPPPESADPTADI